MPVRPPAYQQRSLVLPPDVSMVSFDPEDRYNFSSLRRWCGGIGPAFAATGVGKVTPQREATADRRRSCAALIRQMSTENQLWGAPRIHGELLKLWVLASLNQTVAKYMVKRRGPPKSGMADPFCENHAPDIAARHGSVRSPGHWASKRLYGFVVVRN